MTTFAYRQKISTTAQPVTKEGGDLNAASAVVEVKPDGSETTYPL